MTDEAAPTLRFAPLERTHSASLGDLFTVLVARGDDRNFHPHPLTREEALARATYAGRDAYFVALDGERVVGYGMLRGWDEGFEIPSLGIALHPDARRRGASRAFMLFLHEAARRRGARRVRLTVHPGNAAAVRLYEGLGYRLERGEGEQLVGHVAL